MIFDVDSYDLAFDKYSTLIKWIFIIIQKKDKSKITDLEKEINTKELVEKVNKK